VASYVRHIPLPVAGGNQTLVDRLKRDATKMAERELGVLSAWICDAADLAAIE
jgi:hypothetical protein